MSDFTSCEESVNGHFVAYSDEFQEVVGKDPQFYTVIETDAHEGPVYVGAENALYFTTLPASSNIPVANARQVAIRKISLEGERFPLTPQAVMSVRGASNMANGMSLDLDGRLVICEQGTRTTPARISRLDIRTGTVETLVDQWRGLRFNSPNDVVVKSDGTVWFTDPSYGALQGFKDAPLVGDYVYRYDPATQQTSVVADSFNKPNGLAFSPDESILYINDSGAIQGPGSYFAKLPHHIRAFDVRGGRQLGNGRLFAVVSPGIPDGLKVDTAGRVYSSSASGVQVFNRDGDLIGEIIAPGVANFTFGGPQNNVLYLMADTRIWAARIQAVGATRPPLAR
ncbi:SMP-30/gluconolactonase/LRE family protein [Marinobacterium sedimentorum]|uniref:SMP-30/gluconolactonase/LRE family protein n=1 Tax=Marinobacterium sedimentorum TaxID=2927804 RepID=UPI0020C60896|nr:SMP-30/gluconolactonase/LRE family protein [Marinobacterium sedimentorum]MCP8689865.1 SMP-30/gluconolactonase/LRE family protein [Marinobacterium sedimentorum]